MISLSRSTYRGFSMKDVSHSIQIPTATELRQQRVSGLAMLGLRAVAGGERTRERGVRESFFVGHRETTGGCQGLAQRARGAAVLSLERLELALQSQVRW